MFKCRIFHWNINPKDWEVYIDVTKGNENPPVCLLAWLKNVLLFLTNQTVQFISRGYIVCFCFSENLLLRFLLWHDFKILVKSRQERTFSCLSVACNIQQKYFFFLLKAKCLVFHLLDRRTLNLIYMKLRKVKISIAFKSLLIFFSRLTDFDLTGLRGRDFGWIYYKRRIYDENLFFIKYWMRF